MLDHLRQVIGLRGYGQRDPLNEYKAESFNLFEAMSQSLREAVTAQLMRVEIQAAPPQQPQPRARCRSWRRIRSIRRPARTRWRWPWPAPRRSRATASGRPRRCGAGAARVAQTPVAQSARPGELGQGRPQRGVPLRLRQEIQALSRAIRLTEIRESDRRRTGMILIRRPLPDHCNPAQRPSNEPAGTTGCAPLIRPLLFAGSAVGVGVLLRLGLGLRRFGDLRRRLLRLSLLRFALLRLGLCRLGLARQTGASGRQARRPEDAGRLRRARSSA